eukprot:5345977-Prymnesium_polylepis.1
MRAIHNAVSLKFHPTLVDNSKTYHALDGASDRDCDAVLASHRLGGRAVPSPATRRARRVRSGQQHSNPDRPLNFERLLHELWKRHAHCRRRDKNPFLRALTE